MKKKSEINFNKLVQAIKLIHKELVQQTGYAVNASLTLRNWMIGGYMIRFAMFKFVILTLSDSVNVIYKWL